MKLVPLGDRVVLKQLVAEETTKSGIVLPGQAKEKPQQAEVIAVGPGGVVDGKEVTMQVKVGDQVIFSKYAGTEVKLDEVEYIVVKQNDILAVVES
ncbi:MAG: co-chaperone GroES [Lachnospiraceae bacterium]|nr:co-chaperone GroES [Lachnospiraceae bacterium]